MSIRFLAAVVSILALSNVAGCAAQTDDPSHEAISNVNAGLASYDDNTKVARLASGLFKNSTGVEVTITPSGPSRRYYVDWGYWIDLKVQNLCYEKKVGIVWTSDNWQTATVSYASYEYGLDSGYEQWGIDLTGRAYSGSPPIIEYATFAEMNGAVYWGKDNNQSNYVLYP